MTTDARFARQILLFGSEGQKRLREQRIVVVGIGGLGTHAVQQLALLGVGALVFIDSEELEDTNRNRYVTAQWDDIVPGTRKVDIGRRLVNAIDPSIAVETIHDTLVSDQAFKAIRDADCVFGCLDREGARLILNEVSAAYGKRSSVDTQNRPLMDG